MIDSSIDNLPELKLNKLSLYFGEDFVVDDCFIIHQPTIQEIMDIGDDEFYSTLNIFIGNTTMYRLPLWNQGIDWNKISDFELFIMLTNNMEMNDTSKLLFGDLDFSKFQYKAISIEGEENNNDSKAKLFYFDLDQGIVIDENIYMKMREGLRYIFNIYPKAEFAKGKTTKEWIIQEEKNKLEQNKALEKESFLLPLISFCVNHPGFKYKLQELREVGIVQFMDSVKRLQIYENTSALLIGANSGFVDTSKIDAERFDFTREK